MTADILSLIVKTVQPGMSGRDISDLVKAEIKKLGSGASAAFLNYEGFPDVICISRNAEVVHGIPNDKPFEKGDIVGFDFGINYQGMITDAARSVIIGNESKPEVQRLLDGTREALTAGIKAIKGPTPVGDISAAVQAVLERFDFGIVRDLVGHGVGHEVHEEPNIPNYGRAGEGPVLEVGMSVALEPMATLGQDAVVLEDDRWTISTRDGSLSGHFEDTVLITDHGAEILTRP